MLCHYDAVLPERRASRSERKVQVVDERPERAEQKDEQDPPEKPARATPGRRVLIGIVVSHPPIKGGLGAPAKGRETSRFSCEITPFSADAAQRHARDTLRSRGAVATRASKKWFVVRVTLLAAVLVIVALYAWRDHARRKERTEWKRTLDVALVIVREGSVSAEAIAALQTRTRELETTLSRQFARYRSAPARPFSFVTFGPTDLAEPLPAPPGDGFVAAAKYAWQLRSFTSDVDDRAGVPTRGFDARIYLVVRPPSDRGFVEGMSEHGGRVGVALAELDESTVDLSLFVAAHELFHTLGANDRYDANGRTLFPEGLAEPEKSPLFPQRYAELMARNRPLDAEREVPPTSLGELWVGAKTAEEVGWTR